MQKIRILSDGAADIPPEICREYRLETIPFYVSLDGRVRKDTGITPGEIVEFVTSTGIQPGTIACSPEDYGGQFRKSREDGYESVICVTASEKISASFANAAAAADGMSRVFVLDSGSLSGGEGILVLECAQMVRGGMTAEEIMQAADKLKRGIHASMLLDNASYIRKGGRCAGLDPDEGSQRSGAWPEIIAEEGSLRLDRYYTGTRKEAIRQYVDAQMTSRPPARADRILVVHTGCPVDVLDMVKDYLTKLTGTAPIGCIQARGALVCHSGPNALGLFYI